MNKKLAAFFLALTLLTGGASAFSDVDEGLYYAAPIAWAVERGITTGTSETTFSPDNLCTRGQIITFLWRAAGSPEPESQESPYADVAADMNRDIYRAILWAGETGVIQFDDLDADTFSPNAPCDRASAVRFLWRYAGSPDAGVPAAYTDVSPEADYAQAVAWAVEAGITSGTSDTTFSPGETCTRGQIVTFLYRCINEAASGEKVTIPEDPAPANPEPKAEARPLRTYTGTGEARSLGLDGSDFTSEDVYEAQASVEVYSSGEAVFTVKVPFPLFQACTYTVRFQDPEQPERSFQFTFYRWDEAFADIIPWEGEHNRFRFVDSRDPDRVLSIRQDDSEDDRIGGALVRRVTLAPDSDFSFSMLEGCALSCEVGSNM